MTKLISWNVNGLRACVGKGFLDFFREAEADVFCIQESKLQEGQIELDLPGYHQYWNYARKKGYSGTAMFTKEDFLAYLKKLEENKPVVFCGDLNVAHKEIDLKNPKTNRKNAGFTDEERGKFTDLLAAGFVDTFRYFYPDLEGTYSWWSYRFSARAKNAGWRIDYFCVSESLKDRLVSASIHNTVMGSDHCPVELVIE